MKFINLLSKMLWILLVIGLLAGCKTRPYAHGNLDEIIVFADSLDWLEYKDAVHDVFGKEYLTPMPESEYVLKWRPARLMTEFQTYRNVMFLGRLDSQAPVSRMVNGLLNEQIKAGINKGEFFYIPQTDVWALGQYVVFLVAPGQSDMVQRLYDEGELAYDHFQDSYYQRVEQIMFRSFEKTDLSEYISNHFPFTLRIQADFDLVDESLDNRYIWLRRLGPDRSLAIHYIPYSDSIVIDKQWIMQQRNKLAEWIYEGDVVVPEETKMLEVQFANQPAYRLEGTWKNLTYYVGGPFRTTAFVDKNKEYIYLVDIYVQAIGKRKKYYLDQLDIMAHTFRSVDKKSDTAGAD